MGDRRPDVTTLWVAASHTFLPAETDAVARFAQGYSEKLGHLLDTNWLRKACRTL